MSYRPRIVNSLVMSLEIERRESIHHWHPRALKGWLLLLLQRLLLILETYVYILAVLLLRGRKYKWERGCRTGFYLSPDVMYPFCAEV